ncbi:MAG: hypothetical protein ABW189_02580 [Rickettsiales bacterium]
MKISTSGATINGTRLHLVISEAPTPPEAQPSKKNAALSMAQCVASDEREYKALWQFVILQALIDAQSGSPKPEAKRARAESIAWFTADNEDFREVCALAGMDPHLTAKGARRVICERRREGRPSASSRRNRSANDASSLPPLSSISAFFSPDAFVAPALKVRAQRG